MERWAGPHDALRSSVLLPSVQTRQARYPGGGGGVPPAFTPWERLQLSRMQSCAGRGLSHTIIADYLIFRSLTPPPNK